MLNNRYEILNKLGEGGFAITYKGIDHLTNRLVSIKVSDHSLALEAKIMKLLKEVPYISHIYDYFRLEGKEYIVKRYIAGQSLLEMKANDEKNMNKANIMQWLDSISFILNQMHHLGIIHRDISPGNMILSEDNLYLIDFGGATSFVNKKYENKEIYVHQGLNAPEFAKIEEQGPWTDIYSLAGTILYLLTGEGVPSAESRKLHDPIPDILRKSTLSRKQQNAIMRALQPAIKDRFQDVLTFADSMTSNDHNGNLPTGLFKVDYYAKTSIGSKEVNQDNFMVDTRFRFADDDCFIQGQISCKGEEIHVVAVADGVSSTCHSELASMAVSQAISHFVRQYRHSSIYPQLLLEDLLDNLNEKIITLSKKIGMTASTIALFLWSKDTYYFASIGDSRIYMSHNKKIQLLTSPQTIAHRKIRNGEATCYADYNKLYSYLGKQNVIGSQMAQYGSGKIADGDSILLCTDGIAKKIPNDRLEKILYKKKDKVLEAMWKYVEKSNHSDNCTAIVLRFFKDNTCEM